MLQSMRDKMQGLIAGTIATIIALTFVLWGVQNYLRTGSEAQVVAKVNGKKITKTQENIAYERLKRSQMMMLEQGVTFDRKTQAQLRKDVRRYLIQKEVLAQAMAKMGLSIGQEQLWAMIRGLPIFQVNGNFSVDQFRQVTERVSHSQKDFLDNIKHSLMQAQLEEGIIGSAFVLPDEITRMENIFKQRRDFGYVVVMPERFAANIKVDSANIQKYYEQHKSDFTIPEKISLQYVEISSKSLDKQIKASEEQLKQYYQSHINLYSTPKKWQIEIAALPLSTTANTKAVDAAKKKLLQFKAGDDWANIKVDGVQISKVWLTKNEAGAELTAQFDKLNVGQVSQPFRTKDGYNVGKILAIQPEVVTPYKNVVTKVKQSYKRQQSAQLFAEVHDKVVELAYTNSDTLEPVAREFGSKIQVTDLVTRAGAKSGILANSKFIKAAFSEAVLKHSYNSSPLEVEPGKLVVLRIKDYVPETVQPLNKVRSIIMEKLKAQEMRKKAYDFSQELLAQLRQGKSGRELVKKNDLVWYEVNDVGYYQQNKDKNAQLVAMAFDLPKPQANLISATVVDFKGGYAVLQLFKTYDNKSSERTKKGNDFLKSLAGQLGQFDYHIFIHELMSQAKIKINDETNDK
jgi:peptidyl-prolyl cis-trans isomerase D